MSLYTLVYHSKALIDFDRHAMHSLLFVSRRNNMAKHITGVLLYADGHFIQVLEGKKPLVLDLYQTIQNDTRHVQVRTIYEKQIQEREFADWSMGYKELTRTEFRNIPSLNMFLGEETGEWEKNSVEVYKLLVQFKQDPGCFS